MRQAEHLTKQPAPVSALTILSLHDAAEMFLDLVAEAAEAPSSRHTSFMEFWDALNKANPPIALPARRQMEKLNRARVGLKHQGLRASDDQVQEHLIHTRDFLDEACEMCFGIPLSQISLVSLIRNPDVRKLIDEALALHNLGEFQSSLTNTAIAFAIGVPSIRRGFSIPSGSIANVGRTMGGVPADAVDGEGRRAIEKLASEYGKALSLLSLGADLRDYDSFRQLTPIVFLFGDGNPTVQWMRNDTPTADQSDWCINFFVDLMLRIEAGGERPTFQSTSR